MPLLRRVPAAVPAAVLAAVLAAGLAAGLAGCTGPGPAPGQGVPPPPSSAAPPRPSASERLGLATGWGPDRRGLDRAARQVARLSVPELAGQVIVARFAGTAAPVDLVRRLHLGGVVAFESNVVSAAQVRDLTERLQRRAGRDWPVLVGVDQEGGIVERLRAGTTRFPAFMSAGAAGRPALTRQVYAAGGAELRWMGVNVDFAPDADVTTGPEDPTIGSRSAGSDPRVVAEQALAAARGFRDAGVVPVLKHFPGHGSVTTDSHVGLPVQRRSLRALRESDLVPFRAGVAAGLPAIMVGHLAVRAVDPGVPATLSRPVVTGMLRGDLGFEGVVASDALEMAALRGRSAPAVQFLRAGGDLVLMPADAAVARRTIATAVRAGRLPRRRLEQAAARVVALLSHEVGSRPASRAGTAAGASRRLSAAALTVATGPCSGPLTSGTLVPMGEPGAVVAFRDAASRAGLPLGQVRYLKPPRPEAPPAVSAPVTGTRPAQRRASRAARDRARAAYARRVAAWERIEPTPLVDGTPVRLGTTEGPGGPGVLVATGTPYLLGYADEPVEIATYGSTPGAMSALVEVLRGRARAPGRLPVAVSGVQRRGC